MIEQNTEWKVGDKGFIRYLDHMGSDESICNAARISYGKGTRKVSDDRNLIRYLMRYRHTSPFEMAEVQIHIKCPIYVMRQLVRHRTANLNEYSARYSEMIDDIEVVKDGEWRSQSTTNKQGSGDYVSCLTNDFARDREDEQMGGCTIQQLLCGAEEEVYELCKEKYEFMLKCGVAREQARKIMPLSNYTEVVWKCDLHNLLHCLRLRSDSHAQLEIRQYSDIIGNEIAAKLFPLTWEAFQDYQVDSVTFSGPEIKALKYMQFANNYQGSEPLSYYHNPIEKLSKREIEEFQAKIQRLDLSF